MTAPRESILRGARQALAHAKGEGPGRKHVFEIPEKIDIPKIRRKLKMSQRRFAETYGFDVKTLSGGDGS